MAKLFVVITGLFALVEPKRESRGKDPAIVLLRRVREGTMIEGKKIEVHEPFVRFRRKGEAHVTDLDLVGQDIFFEPPAVEPFMLKDPEGIITLRDFLDSVPSVNPVLTKLEHVDLNAFPDLGGRTFLRGGSIQPVEMKDTLDTEQIFFEIGSELVGAKRLDTNQEKNVEHRRKVANGMVYEMILTGDSLRLVVGDENFELEPEKDAALGNLPHREGEECYLVWLQNTRKGGGPLPEEFDRDFHLLYDFVDQAAVRWVPLLEGPPIQEDGDGGAIKPGDPPGTCMPVGLRQ